MRIALCGPAGAGKSTVAAFLEREAGCTRHRFAKPLKDMLRAIGLTEREIEGDLKEVPCPALMGRTPRHALVTLGTEWGRDLIHPDLWVNAWHRTLPAGNVVTEDLRFRNEWAAASAAGFMTLVAGFRLKHSRSWISRLRSTRASMRPARASPSRPAALAARSCTRSSLVAGTQDRRARWVMAVSLPGRPPGPPNRAPEWRKGTALRWRNGEAAQAVAGCWQENACRSWPPMS